MRFRSKHRGSRRRPERAATLVEYSLLVALLAVPTVGAISMLEDGAATKSQSSAAGISSRTIPPAPTTAPAGTSAPTTAAPTTAAPTTAAPTTTTTTTTTTTPPTTTTAPPSKSVSTWGSMATSKTTNPTRWKTTNTLTIKNDYGVAVSGATVTIKVEYRTTTSGTTGWVAVSPDLVATTGSDGTLNVDSGLYRSSSSNNSPPWAEQIRFTVVSVTKSGLTWQSNTTPTVATRPA